MSRNSAELLQEMLAPVKASADRAGLHETFVTDLADQCYRCVGGDVCVDVCWGGGEGDMWCVWGGCLGVDLTRLGAQPESKHLQGKCGSEL